MEGKLSPAEKKRPLGRPSPNRRLGSSNQCEISPPKDMWKHREIEIFADTETYYKTYGLQPWDFLGEPNFESKLSLMSVKILLLVGKYGRQSNVLYFDEENELDMINQFMSNLSYIYNVEKRTPTIYFHNASYDITALGILLKTMDPDLSLYFFCQRRTRGFIRGCMQSPKYNFYCRFGDTLKYDKTLSIEEAGEMFGKRKIGGFPYGMCDPELVGDNLDNAMVSFTDIHTGQRMQYSLNLAIKYAERDVDILIDLFYGRERLNEDLNAVMVEEYQNGNRAQRRNFRNRTETQGSHTKKICDEHLKEQGYDIVDGMFRFDLAIHYLPGDLSAIYQRVISSNCGGFTSYNKYISRYDCLGMGKVIKTFDVNSMYPYIMTGELPYGEILTEKPVEGGSCVTGLSVRVRSCKGMGLLSCLSNEAFGDNKMKDTPFIVEKKYWDFVLKHCDIDYSIEATYYQRTIKVINPLIRKYYKKRLEYKALKEKAAQGTPEYETYTRIELGLKILLNSLYGKMCEKGYHVNVAFCDLRYETYDNPSKKYPCILTGSFITYRARLKLLNTILKTVKAGHDFLYADTDSITLGCTKGTDLTPIFGKESKKLGAWKDEGTYDLYLNLFKKKKYFLVNRETEKFKLALSGIPKRIQRVFEHQLKTNFKRTVADMEKIFNTEENGKFLRCKPNSIMNTLDQMIIVNVDFEINSGNLDPTGTIAFTEDNYVMQSLCQ